MFSLMRSVFVLSLLSYPVFGGDLCDTLLATLADKSGRSISADVVGGGHLMTAKHWEFAQQVSQQARDGERALEEMRHLIESGKLSHLYVYNFEGREPVGSFLMDWAGETGRTLDQVETELAKIEVQQKILSSPYHNPLLLKLSAVVGIGAPLVAGAAIGTAVGYRSGSAPLGIITGSVLLALLARGTTIAANRFAKVYEGGVRTEIDRMMSAAIPASKPHKTFPQTLLVDVSSGQLKTQVQRFTAGASDPETTLIPQDERNLFMFVQGQENGKSPRIMIIGLISEPDYGFRP